MSRVLRGALWATAGLFALHLAADLVVIGQRGGMAWLRHARIARPAGPSVQTATKRAIFAACPPIETTDTVIIGDSQVALSGFEEMLPQYHVRLRGIEGESLAEVAERLPEILRGHPRCVIVCAGINDIQRRVPTAASAAAAKRIVSLVSGLSPETALFGLEVCAPNEELYAEHIARRFPGVNMPTPQSVATINTALREAGITLIELPLTDPSGRTRAELVCDGLHWNGAADRIVADRIAVALAHLGS